MFDAKSILDVLLRGGAQPQTRRQPSDLSDISDLLKQLAGADQDGSPASGPARRTPTGSDRDDYGSTGRAEPPRRPAQREEEEDDMSRDSRPRGGGLEDILRDVLGGGGAGGGGGIGDILRRMQTQGGRGGGGGIGDILGEILGQATSGGRGAASRLTDAAAGSGQNSDILAQLSDRLSQMTGRSPDELLAKLKEFVANNQLGTGAALGGLGALILGTQAGRSLAGTAIKLGGLAVIGGLAYKAYQDYQRGQPVAAGGQPQALLAAPEGSGFEPAAVSNNSAILLVRAMIAAAAADGRIDAGERGKILAGLQQGGLSADAQRFLARELENPASVEDLAADVSTQEQAVQVYTAARVAVDPDEEEEHEFLAALARSLGIDNDLAAHIDATARSAES
jgi:uncharacterized membrane protein YebE (DUF533 family)